MDLLRESTAARHASWTRFIQAPGGSRGIPGLPRGASWERCARVKCESYEAFENHCEKAGDYHERLLERVSLDLPGIRPRFLLAELVTVASDVSAAFPEWVRHFCAVIQAER
jgi:hypothetical protein